MPAQFNSGVTVCKRFDETYIWIAQYVFNLIKIKLIFILILNHDTTDD